MGFAKYFEDNNEIIQDRLDNRRTKARGVNKVWRNDVIKLNEIAAIVKKYEDENRVKEYLDIKESLQYKINLLLSVESSLTNDTVKMIAHSLNVGLENSLSKVRKIIRSIDGYQNVSYSSKINCLDIKKNLVENIFYKVENLINDLNRIDREDFESIKEDLLLLISWYYDDESLLGNINNEKANNTLVGKFIHDELGADFYTCPYCGKYTIFGLKFCIECTEELK